MANNNIAYYNIIHFLMANIAYLITEVYCPLGSIKWIGNVGRL